MWTQLNVWIMRGDNACLVDDSTDWKVFAGDAHGDPFQWKGIAYTQGLRLFQPGHRAVEIPPGAYVVWAERGDGAVRTHKAVVHVGFEPQVGVRLLPDLPRDRPDPHECAVAITSVVGVGSPTPSAVRVTGTAAGCAEVEVTVTGSGSKSAHVAVGPNGDWVALLAEVPGVTCGRPVSVRVACATDPRCQDAGEIQRLECVPHTGG